MNTKIALRFIKPCCAILMALWCPISDRAQVADIDSLLRKYPFIKKEQSVIHNDSVLGQFFEKLTELKAGKRTRVNIVHIGDSHIQADFFSGTVRQLIQSDYGNAGRGFIFPYRVARSNEPPSYKSFSNVKWESKRNAFPDQPLPIGIGGFTIETRDTGAALSILIKDQGKLDYSFNKFTLFHEKGAGNLSYAVCDDLNCRIGKIDSRITGKSRFASVQEFPFPMHQLLIRCNAGDSAACSRIYGLLLENGKPGVLYNMIGVNGAEYRHYNLSTYFQEQLAYLEPDLVIISMGTNEAYASRFSKEDFLRNIDTLVTGIRARSPMSAILLTTPGDSFRKSKKGKVRNPDMEVARNAVIEYAQSHGCAWWDLYGIMGGYGSMAKWYLAHLSAKDRVHFNGTGYMLQGGLLYQALKTAASNSK